MPFDTLNFAFDRSMRRYDEDGHLHVAVSHLTKACVNPYRGSEIPGYEQLGLDPNRIYDLFRHPAELQKAAPTFNNLKVLDQHIPVTAADESRERVIGSTGTDAHWNAPYLDNSLVFWSEAAIALIESGQMRELSAGYRYEPVMQPGLYMGQRYDGVMTNIRGNHIALVESGRAGSDVVVMDGKLKEVSMKTALSPHAAYIVGSTVTYIKPWLAKDKKMPDIARHFAGVTAKNWPAKRTEIEAAIIRVTKPVLAMDAEVHIHEHLDGAGAGAPDDVAPGDPGGVAGAAPGADPADGGEGNLAFGGAASEGSDPSNGGAGGDDVAAKVQSLLQGQIDDDTLAIIMAALKKPDAGNGGDPADGGGKDNMGGADNDDCATDEDGVAEKLPGLANKDTPAMDANKPITKQAMDAAIAKAIDDTKKRLMAREEANKFVRPWIGEPAVAMDNATEVYKFALEQLGEDVTDIHPSAYKAILQRLPKPGEQQQSYRAPLAMDKGSNDKYLERFPNANRLRAH